ncbi:succinate dehydrogenase / fumarate reductase cytochrome b subunit [Streptoalloteichus tenebrarius]|uniref:Succinate dehydrogenase / fumarate reductase cytochrome b subunit n=2 Tax=Streptoalloteichus tenebrarius (strain ATCC 17920 / DSM 40477 / JCM 4838 / CBS 697.72 / NBRC 16177 / NCIMB 11028 / NRRL B-12390 / A12253. 1 / ISP 5477) TaxID=1933 RepID=A0ABT1HWB1_STRSD|nr:succinate dehydrogenase / fumarate reductase cytochrome b subunit [Streptoalloteichus tenebrarius]BFF00677.1 succinate dehydrogenase cytochrome b subunit [Streptoalloteichus tenebrarius]
MAVTGGAMFLFVVGHMAGNLKVLFGPEAFNEHPRWLRGIGEGLLGYGGFVWIARVGLLLCLVLHMTAAIQLARRAAAARPARYQRRGPVRGSYAARTMRWGGVIIALFLVYHLMDLTAGWLNPVGDLEHPYRNVTADFRHWYVTLAYTVAIVTLGFHIRHGLWSALQSLGASNARRQRVLKGIALGVAVLICAGFLAVPFSVLTGLVK